MTQSIRWFSELGMADLDQVGGKNASLGEMVSHLTRLGVQVPDGFATTSEVYREFLGATGLAERIDQRLTALDTDDTIALAEAGREIRELVIAQPFPAQLEADIRASYQELAAGSGEEASFAVRSSATAEDLPDASFAGQQETFLNVRGIDSVLTAIREVFASLYNDRAIAYRVHHDFEHAAVALSAGVQKMVRSDLGSSGVMFTVDTESGFDQAVFITSAYGLGEGVVQGAVNPDEFYVYKPGLRAGRPAILKRAVGEKATKMVYTEDTTVGRTTEFIPVDPADAGGPVPDRPAGRRPRPPGADHRGALRAADGHRVGPGRRRRRPVHPPGPPRDRAVPRREHGGEVHPVRPRRRARGGPGDRREDRRRPGAGAGHHRPHARVPARRGAGRGHDRSRLGADHEARRRHRHQPWRPHLPRRDHRPRAGDPRRGRHRGRHARAGRRRRGHRLRRGGRYRLRLRGAAGLHRLLLRGRLDATSAHQDHDERGQPRTGLRLLPAAQRRRGTGTAGVHHQPPDRHPPPGAAGAGSAAERGAGDRRAGAGQGRRLRLPARVLRPARRRGRGHHRRRLRAGAGDRADERLQVQRVREPAGRLAVRAGRGEPDDRLPRRRTLPLGRTSPSASRWSARRCATCARRWA